MKIIQVLAVTATLLTPAAALAEGDVKAGEKLFKRCSACHALEAGKKKVGPSLHGIFGKKAGEVEGYKYSKAMKNSGLVWTIENLKAFLKKPRKVVKGTKMAFGGIKKEKDLDDLLVFLKAKLEK